MPRTKEFDEDTVLIKAMHLFWQKGYHNTSIQDLVEFMGINRASMYLTFGGKELLFKAALKTYVELSSHKRMEIASSEESGLKAIELLFSQTVYAMTTDSPQRGCLLVNSLTELLPTDTDLREYMLELQDNGAEVYRKCLIKAIEQGELSKETDIDSAIDYLTTLNHGISVVSKLGKTHSELQAQIEKGLLGLTYRTGSNPF